MLTLLHRVLVDTYWLLAAAAAASLPYRPSTCGRDNPGDHGPTGCMHHLRHLLDRSQGRGPGAPLWDELQLKLHRAEDIVGAYSDSISVGARCGVVPSRARLR